MLRAIKSPGQNDKIDELNKANQKLTDTISKIQQQN